MKIIVVCGVHENETASAQMCKELSKNKYTELNNLANNKGGHPDRLLTQKEVVFLNLSGYGSHAFVRRLGKYSIMDIIEVYETHIEKNKNRMPEKWKNFLVEYVCLWKKHVEIWKKAGFKIMEVPEDSEKELDRELAKLNIKYVGYSGDLKEDYPSKNVIYNFLFPPEFKFLVKNEGYNRMSQDTVEDYTQNPLVKRELGTHINAFILDLHCMSYEEMRAGGIKAITRDEERWIECDYTKGPFMSDLIFFPKSLNVNSKKITGEFNKIFGEVGLLLNGSPYFKQHPKNVGLITVEVPAPYRETPGSKIFYNESPSIWFFSNLWRFGVDIPNHWGVTSNRSYYVDPKFYKTGQYENSKKTVAHFIYKLLVWGEKWENTK